MRGTGTPARLSSSLAFYTQRVYLREEIEASFGILGVRNSITFTAFYAESSNISADALAFLPDASSSPTAFDERGFGVRADHKLDAVHHAQRERRTHRFAPEWSRPARRAATTISRLR